MPLSFNHQKIVQEFYIEAFDIWGEIFNDQPLISQGYLIHLTTSKSSSLVGFNDLSFRFSTENHWKYQIEGSLEELTIKLRQFKNELLSLHEWKDFDQYAYIFLFIICKDNKYQLLITSDSFDVSNIISLK